MSDLVFGGLFSVSAGLFVYCWIRFTVEVIKIHRLDRKNKP